MEEKRFDEWNEVKWRLHRDNKIHHFYEGEIWWYAAGENIGREINGKGERFSRPILIIRKYSKESFLVCRLVLGWGGVSGTKTLT